MLTSQRQFGVARILDFRGPLVGLATAERVKQAIDPLTRASSLLVVNLSQVIELDDEILCVLGTAQRVVREHGGEFRVALPGVAGQRHTVRRLQSFFECYNSVEDALADVRSSMGRPILRRAMARVRARSERWWRRILR